MLKKAAVLFGVVLLTVGVLGFVPGATVDHMLLRVFHVNAAHNVVHLLSGAVALWAGLTTTANARLYFRVFGVVYALVAVLGFFVGDGMILGIVSNNAADTWLHVAIAASALYLGFVAKDDAVTVRTAT
jgi:hypothetical protein